ncbi:MAG TPA: ABC transporter permease, partial [Actinomycetes bacterium]|nr:ABC transporter permease [Actinomycetes bacterium]
MSAVTAEPAVRDWRQTLVERPAIALTGVLVVLYLVTATQAPGMLTLNGVRSTLLLACPLAIRAASQTLCMLTGGIDLSTVMTANFAA